MKIDLEKLVDEIMAEMPEGMIPRAYVRNLAEENIDCFDTRSEIMSETKMQLAEESGLEFMLTRDEAEDFLCDEFPDDKWDAVSTDGKVSSRLLKAMEEDEDCTIFEMMKNMPLIPAAKMIAGIVMKNLDAHGVDMEAVNVEQLYMSVIEDLNMYLSELEGFDDDDEYEDDDDEIEYEYEDDDDNADVFNELGIEFDMDDDSLSDPDEAVRNELRLRKGRRSRITRFPGSK